jgi:hypothetical protein
LHQLKSYGTHRFFQTPTLAGQASASADTKFQIAKDGKDLPNLNRINESMIEHSYSQHYQPTCRQWFSQVSAHFNPVEMQNHPKLRQSVAFTSCASTAGTLKLGGGAAFATAVAKAGRSNNPQFDHPYVATMAYVTVPQLLG